MPKVLSRLVVVILMFTGWGAAYAQTQIDTITPRLQKLNVSHLKPGLKQYLVVVQTPAKHKTLNLSYWVRDVKFSNFNGEKVFSISQHWYSADTLSYRTIHSLSRSVDFAPIYHKETLRNRIRAFNWSAEKIWGADTVPGNEAKMFNLNLKAPVFNWNLDIETFEQLPLAAGKVFAINFYDAGLGEPKYVLYKIIGSEKIKLFGDSEADCWKLQTEGKSPTGVAYTQTFWISKKGHEFLKEEDQLGAIIRIKMKLPPTMPNVVTSFK